MNSSFYTAFDLEENPSFRQITDAVSPFVPRLSDDCFYFPDFFPGQTFKEIFP